MKKHLLIAAMSGSLLFLQACSKPAENTDTASEQESVSLADQAVDILDLDHEDVFSLKVGSCFDDDSGEIASDETEEIASIPIRECNEPHDYEVFYTFDLADAPQPPSEAEMDIEIADKCEPAFTEFMGIDYQESIYDYSVFFPTVESWADGDREIACFIVAQEDEKLTKSLKGAKL